MRWRRPARSDSRSAAFQGGLLCVLAPIERHAFSSSGRSGSQCNGVLSEDFNAYIAGGTDPAPVAGASVWIQNGSRDPSEPFTDSLSDALALTICPESQLGLGSLPRSYEGVHGAHPAAHPAVPRRRADPAGRLRPTPCRWDR